MRTLLAVHAHPDDETLTTGGTLARYSAVGVRTIVITCTRGDLGGLNGLVADDVGTLREQELRTATERLGVSRLVQLGYLDSGMPGTPDNRRNGAFCAAPVDEAAQRIARVIHDERPQVLIAYDETGGYGHPDHVQAHRAAMAACAAAGSAAPAKVYFVRLPRSYATHFVESLRGIGIPAPASAATGADAGPDVHEVGVADELVTTTIDVRDYVDVKRAALVCHRSQMPPEHFLMRMPTALAHELWAAEFYSLLGAPAGTRETDLFAGLH